MQMRKFEVPSQRDFDFPYFFLAPIVTIENRADMQAKFEGIFEPGGECPNPLPGRKATRFQ